MWKSPSFKTHDTVGHRVHLIDDGFPQFVFKECLSSRWESLDYYFKLGVRLKAAENEQLSQGNDLGFPNIQSGEEQNREEGEMAQKKLGGGRKSEVNV